MTVMSFILMAAGVMVVEVLIALGLAATRRLGTVGRRVNDALCRAPLLDVLVAVITLVPPAIGIAIGSWSGLAAALSGQLIAIPVWIFIHERAHRRAAHGARLVKAQNAIVGRWRNHASLWFSIGALPFLWIVRVGEILLYPPLCWLLGFPRCRHRDWINVSRHKFEGLVGHDLLWCLYCDWMTGIHSLAGEMLRNVESFWCPIRFADGRKCENCRVDFPDVDRWASAAGGLGEAVWFIEQHYGSGRREWIGHPARLTVNGECARDAGANEPGSAAGAAR